MKPRIIPSRQQQKQIQSRDLTPLARALAFRRAATEGGVRELVEGEELLVVADEGVGVVKVDGEESARFEGLAGEDEGLWRGFGSGKEGVEGEEFALGEREEGLDFSGGRRSLGV